MINNNVYIGYTKGKNTKEEYITHTLNLIELPSYINKYLLYLI